MYVFLCLDCIIVVNKSHSSTSCITHFQSSARTCLAIEKQVRKQQTGCVSLMLKKNKQVFDVSSLCSFTERNEKRKTNTSGNRYGLVTGEVSNCRKPASINSIQPQQTWKTGCWWYISYTYELPHRFHQWNFTHKALVGNTYSRFHSLQLNFEQYGCENVNCCSCK